jgi:hypothetical protein
MCNDILQYFIRYIRLRIYHYESDRFNSYMFIFNKGEKKKKRVKTFNRLLKRKIKRVFFNIIINNEKR